ncbi:MFS transporter [Metapseudomonas lalkuanensis]|uniref:MFS transporter n=1 Tax=Metapseudomonas lalkuanensis TaxID=2604832 RepID=UPI001CF5B56A|nr:MFS transporter [Pseudomonas lalkuanensis]UCP00275.1 MFS transporter [Pseudomonas lalkuanensis]
MVALLILGGLLLIVTGLVWLVMLAFGTSLLWGFGSLLPPVTLAYVLYHWRNARKAVALGAMGFIPLVVGLTMLAAQDPERLQAILSLRWLGEEDRVRSELDIRLNGELNGQRFSPLEAELVDGILSLREGQDFYARRELTIRLGNQPQGALRLDILPQDVGPKPEVEINWLLPEQELPEARRIPRGYTLHLDLRPVAPNRLAGDFHLVLPPKFATTLTGHLEVFTDRLRYREGRVDPTYDSRDTLAYVIRDYLQRRFTTRNVELMPLPAVSLPARELDLEVEARVDGQAQHLALQLAKSETKGWRVGRDSFPPLAEPNSAPQAPSAAQDSAPAADAARPVDRRLRFSLQRLLSNPSQYQALSMRVYTVRGSTAEGRFTGLDHEGRILIRRNLGGAGAASFSFDLDEVSHVELLEP